MSFDVYFVRRGVPWNEAMDAIEQSALSDAAASLSPERLAQWERITAAIADGLPGMERFEGDDVRELSHDPTGMQLSLFPGEIALSVPYWHTDDDAVEVTNLLRQVAEIVERETGLVAYDPQADDAFLSAGATTAAETMTHVRHQMETRLGPAASASLRRPWWRRWFGR